MIDISKFMYWQEVATHKNFKLKPDSKNMAVSSCGGCGACAGCGGGPGCEGGATTQVNSVNCNGCSGCDGTPDPE